MGQLSVRGSGRGSHIPLLPSPPPSLALPTGKYDQTDSDGSSQKANMTATVVREHFLPFSLDDKNEQFCLINVHIIFLGILSRMIY